MALLISKQLYVQPTSTQTVCNILTVKGQCMECSAIMRDQSWQANATVMVECSSCITTSADSSGADCKGRLTVAACLSGKSRGKAFDSMNGIAANMLLHLTSSVRFEGPLNVDLNEITTNLVPFPRLHFLLASLSPLAAPRDVSKLAGAPRAVDQVAGPARR